MDASGLIHIYEGDGKGKTTAAVGLSIRYAGSGGKVIFTQFLKQNDSGELAVLEQIEGIKLVRCDRSFGFTFQMTQEQREEAAAYYEAHLQRVLEMARKEEKGLLVLDEAIGACAAGMILEEELLEFLKHKPAGLEVVLTGRNPSVRLLEIADYVTVMQKKKHPYDRGIQARKGIER